MNKPVRIGIDTRDLKLATTGTKTYLSELLKSIKNTNVEHYSILEFGSIWKPYWGKNIIGKIYEHINFFIWKQFTLPLKSLLSNSDLLICTDYYLPLLKIKAKHIVVFHDALIFDHPSYYHPAWLKWFKFISLNAAKKADAIIVPSVFSLSRLSIFLPLLKEKMHVIYQGPKTIEQRIAPSLATQTALDNIGNIPFLLHVGGLEKRKNIPFLIKALHEVRKSKNIKLLLVGRPNPKIYNNSYQEIIETIKNLNLENDVHFTGYVPDEDLPFIYKRAMAYILPSTYEGFGIPILEGFQYHLPVIVANNSCLTEIGGEAVSTFSPFHLNQLVDRINELLENSTYRNSLVEKGNHRLTHFNWDKSASDYLHIIDNITKLNAN